MGIFDQSKRKKLLYTLRHKVAFLRTEWKLTGQMTWRGFCHDNDKVWMYLTSILTVANIHTVHRTNSRHHDNKILKTKEDYIEMVIDWECARMTKPDKPLNARQTLLLHYPYLAPGIAPVLKDLGL